MIKEQRNLLLTFLATVFPGSLLGEGLHESMLGAFPEYDRLHAAKDLAYLEEKGYAVRMNPVTQVIEAGRHHTIWHQARWKASAKGTEVAYRIIEDPALEI
jgi:hypothetical protein